MSYKRFKDKTNLVAETKMVCTATRPYYFDVYLWSDHDSFLNNTIGNDDRARGCCELAPSLIDPESKEEIPTRKMGEVHFIVDQWDEEVVAHELCHALIHRLRSLCPSTRSVIEQEENYEEDICYEFGKWNKKIYRWLWSCNPNPNYVRI